MLNSFYVDLLDTFGQDVQTDPCVATLIAPSVSYSRPGSYSFNMDDEVTFQKEADGNEETLPIDLSTEEGQIKLEKFREAHKDVFNTDATPVSLRNYCKKKETSSYSLTSKSEIKDGKSFSLTTFSGSDMNVYIGYKEAKDIVGLKFAIAGEDITAYAETLYPIDGDAADEYPLALRLRQVEFIGGKIQTEIPFLVVCAQNDYGARASRVFFNLKYIAMSSSYDLERLSNNIDTIYKGQVGPKVGQLHAWPTLGQAGIPTKKNGTVDSEVTAKICDAIAKAIPSLKDYMADISTDFSMAEAAGHKPDTATLDVLLALYAEVV